MLDGFSFPWVHPSSNQPRAVARRGLALGQSPSWDLGQSPSWGLGQELQRGVGQEP